MINRFFLINKYAYNYLYQLENASGSMRYEPVAGGVVPEHESTYTQNFTFDILGNMTTKTSTETVYSEKTIGDALNYSIDFSYAEGFAHRLDHAGDRYYSYDDDGNVVRERNEAMTDSSGTDTGSDDDEWDDWDDWDDDWGDGLGEAGFGFGMGGSGSGSGEGGSGTASSQATVYERIYEWDERDRLTGSTEGNTVVGYVYGEDGNRTNKYSSIGETLYFSSMWTWHNAKSLGSGGQTTKNIYLGTERIVSKLNLGEGHDTYSEEYHKTYYWHTDHLGSAHFITDYQGNEYQRIEYTPYGEEWVELKSDSGDQYLPYKFTGKERDEETGLYYYGARYLDPVYSRWLSTDPAVGEYMSGSIEGIGGIYNNVNLNLYHYAGNNPIKYIDLEGLFDTLSEEAKQFIKESEGFRGNIYDAKDPNHKYTKGNSKLTGDWTIGYGHQLTENELSAGVYDEGITEEEASALFEIDSRRMVEAVNNTVIYPNKLSQNQLDALVSFTYSVGKKGFEKSEIKEMVDSYGYVISMPDVINSRGFKQRVSDTFR